MDSSPAPDKNLLQTDDEMGGSSLLDVGCHLFNNQTISIRLFGQHCVWPLVVGGKQYTFHTLR